MLGLGRASQLAGWWSTRGGNLSASISDTTTATATGGGLAVRPNYFADFTVADPAQQVGMSILDDASTIEIDTDGTGTNAKKQIFAMTFRVGDNWMSTGLPSEGASAFDLFVRFDNDGTDSFRNMALATQPGNQNYVFGTGAGPNVYVDKTLFDNNYRNKWLTCIYATSDNSSDFSFWSGGSDIYGNSWCGRVRLFETETMTPIPGVYSNQGDGWLFNSTGNVPDLNQTWDYQDGGDYSFVMFGGFGDSTLYDRSDLQILSAWYTVGDTVDIADLQWHNQLAGSAMSKTVNGIKPWIAFAFNTAGSAVVGSEGTFGYTNPVYTWGRVPSTSVQIAVPDTQVAPQPPEFTSL